MVNNSSAKRQQTAISLSISIFIATLLLCTAASAQDNDFITVGPYVRFTDPYTAVVRWETAGKCSSIVKFGKTKDRLTRSVISDEPVISHEIVLSNLSYRTKYFYRVGFTKSFRGQKQQVLSSTFVFNNAINYTVMDCSKIKTPYPPDSMSNVYVEAVETILQYAQTGPATKGYCLVYGAGQGRLAFEIAKRTKMMVYGIDTSQENIDTARKYLLAAGVYGSRVRMLRVDSLERTRLPEYFFNLIVSDTVISKGTCPGNAAYIYKLLRPCGGTAILGRPGNCPNNINANVITQYLTDVQSNSEILQNDNNGLWFRMTRPELPQGGSWPRQYGSFDNKADSGGTLLGATGTDDLRIQWLGWPGADFGADRNPRMPSPVSANGKLYHIGLDRILAMDTYNGAVLWSLEIPNLLRVNIPRDSGYMYADYDGLYIAVDDDCWKLDSETGIKTNTFTLTDQGKEWGYVSIYDNMLIGSAQYDGAHYTDYWGRANWYDARSGEKTKKVCSRYMFAFDKDTGAKTWSTEKTQKGVIINSTITIGNNRLYFVECRNPTVTAYSSGRIGLNELWFNQYLVALDIKSGKQLWSKPIYTADGIDVFYMQYASEKLFIMASDKKYNLYAFNAANGDKLWIASHNWTKANHGGHMQHPVIIGNRIYLEPKVYDIRSGRDLGIQMARHGGCPTYAGAGDILVFRGKNPNKGANTTIWDIKSGKTTFWEGLRPSCWLSTITGGGMILSPEGSGGCSCNGWINTSLGFICRTETTANSTDNTNNSNNNTTNNGHTTRGR